MANSVFTDAELKEMKTLLDDPDISSQQRGQMLMALSNAGMVSHQEIDKYSSKYGYDAEDIKEGGEAPLENLMNARKSLDGVNKGKIKDAKKNLDEGGFKTSDEIIGEVGPAIKLFDNFHPLYKQVKQLNLGDGQGNEKPEYVESDLTEDKNSGPGSGQYTHTGGSPQQIRAGLDEFRGMNFGAFGQDANMLGTASSAVDEAKESLDTAWGQGTQDWTGDAKQAAQQQNKAIVDNADKLSEALGRAPENIKTVSGDNKKNVVEYAKAVLQVYGDGKITGLTQQQVADLIKAHEEIPNALRELNNAIQEMENKSMWDHIGDFLTSPFSLLQGALGPVGSILGYVVADQITEENIYAERDKIKQAQADTKQKLLDFANGYDKKVKGFHDQGRNAGKAIQKNYSTLIQQLGKDLEGAFTGQRGPGGDGKGSGAQAITDPGGAGNQQPGGGGGGTSTPPGGGGGNAGGSFTPPQMDGGGGPVAGEQAQGEAGQGGNGQPKPGEAGDGKNPVTGGKLETDPETGEPYPIDPATGEAVKDAAERDTLTVEQGDKKFEFAEPDANGEMGISVDDGNGQLKDYKLDFGNSEDASGGAQPGGQTDGGPAQAGGQNQGLGQGLGGQGQGPGVSQGQNPGEQGRQDFGPQGSGDGAGGAQGGGRDEKVYTPDEDGKIRIQDGDTEIVAEQPDGPDGPTKVTVDDGKGEPTTYTLGEDETAGSEAGGDRLRPAGDAPGDTDMLAQNARMDPAAGGQEPGLDGGSTGAAQAAGDLAAEGGGGAVDAGSEAMQAGAASDPTAGGPAAMPDGMDSADGGASGSAAGDAAQAGPAGTADQPDANGDAGGASGPDDSTAPASSLGSSLGDDALGGGAGEADGSSLGDADMGDSPSGDSAAASGDGDNGGPGGSGDRGGGSGGAGMGGGMMGGGMGGAGGGGGGGDEERQSQFILNAVSDLFGEAVAGNHISGTIGDGVESAVSFSR
ncbi:uncharacterized protein YukE [Prauserella sediminis]|uniref:Uncharacterized protein YukE n=1 Tax=Prauserella sediminis TaxID=577680 RepID=A0A839XHZ4_9PSEU|nr:hypothetical protein [Prauserella sediminis]MBB3662107.1 uncharacterized protein YukE [Prauserella sediminis]